MTVFRILGDQVMTKAAFVDRLVSEPKGLDGLESAESADAHPLSSAFETPEGLEANPGVTQFVPIGLGKPLTILIRDVYTGKHPGKGFMSGGGKQMAIVTGLKDYSVFAASSRAVNFLEKNIKPRTRFKAPSTFNEGTNVVAYSPAVLTDSFHFTIEIAFDRFPDGLFDLISKGLSTAAGVPLLMPAQGYLLAASGLVKIGSNWADALVDGNASFSMTDTLDFNLPGSVPPVADFRVMCDFDASGMTYDPAKGLMTAPGKPYDGDEPYIVISLDGAARKNLESFAPTVATASVLKQFFNMRDGAEASIGAVLDGMKLVNDMKYRKEAESLKARAATALTPGEKADLQRRLEAVNKNILNEALRVS